MCEINESGDGLNSTLFLTLGLNGRYFYSVSQKHVGYYVLID